MMTRCVWGETYASSLACADTAINLELHPLPGRVGGRFMEIHCV